MVKTLLCFFKVESVLQLDAKGEGYTKKIIYNELMDDNKFDYGDVIQHNLRSLIQILWLDIFRNFFSVNILNTLVNLAMI